MSYLGTNKIGKMYLGSTAIGKAYLGSNLVFQQGGAQPVMIPYIRGGADGSYIDTGIVPDSTTRVIVWARNFNPNSGFIFGSRVAFQNQAFALNANTDNQSGRISVNYGDVVNNAPSGDHFQYLSGYHKYEMQPISVSVDDTQLFTGSGTFSGNSLNLHLLGLNNGGAHTNTAMPMDICSCQIYKGDVLVRDFTAVNTPSVGLYDAVSQTLFTNAGSGSFIYGEFDKDAYTPLEYIECTGTQYFDSGIYGANTLDYVVKFRNSGTAAWQELFLAQTSSSSNRYGLMLGNSTTPNRVVYFIFNNTQKYYNYGSSFVGKDLVARKSGMAHALYENNTKKGEVTHTNASFTTTYKILVGVGNHAGGATNYYTGRLYYIGFHAVRSFVPAKKGSNVGMYDTYNDVFYPSATETPFIAGPTI